MSLARKIRIKISREILCLLILLALKESQANGQPPMKILPWAPWKFRSRISPSPKRRVHLGIDYGADTSKIVFRDYSVPGTTGTVLVLHNGSAQIPSRVCRTTTDLLFGDRAKARADCYVYERLKTRVAAEASRDPNHTLDQTTALPDGFRAADLAALTVWFLVSEGHRAIAAQFNGRMEDVEIDMTMGVPMLYFNDEEIKAQFLEIARRAWSFYRHEGLVGSAVSIENARRVVEKHPAAASDALEHKAQDWIRCESEAAIWWFLDSPSVGTGPYAIVDLGAQTTQASLARIFGKVQTAKRSRVLYGAAAIRIALDAVSNVVVESEELSDYRSRPQSIFEPSIFQSNAKARELLTSVREQICQCYQDAWTKACRALDGNALELSAWRQHQIFVIGGGSSQPLLFKTLRIHADQPDPLSVMALEQPTDLVRADHRKIASEDLPFVPVAYGLSNTEPFLPHPYRRNPG
jgi:hypothetical protein